MPYASNFNETTGVTDTPVQFALAANAALSYTFPGDSSVLYQVRYTYTENSNVFSRANAAPTIPGAGTVTTQQYNEFRPGSDGSKRYYVGGDKIYFITPDATAYVGISIQQLPPRQ